MKYLTREESQGFLPIDLEATGYRGFIGKDGKPGIGFTINPDLAKKLGLPSKALWSVRFESYDEIKQFIDTLEKGVWQQEHGEA